MASKQLKLMNDLYASIKERVSKPGLDLATNRDIVENLHLAASEPEAVTYAEVDAGGVSALWCIPQGTDPDRGVGGYSTVQAQSHDAAAKMFGKDHPHLQMMPGAWIEIVEIMPIPGM
jgi:hypothetical protein